MTQHQSQHQSQQQKQQRIPPRLNDAARGIDMDRVARLQEKQTEHMAQEAQRKALHERRMKTSALYRLADRIGQRMVLKNRMGREAFKMSLVVAIPLVGTLLLMQPQYSEYVILNYTPYLEREEVSDEEFQLSKILVGTKRNYRDQDNHYFDMQKDREEQVKRHMEYLKQQVEQHEQQQQGDLEKMERNSLATIHDDQRAHEEEEEKESLGDKFWNRVDSVFEKMLPLRDMATEELLRTGNQDKSKTNKKLVDQGGADGNHSKSCSEREFEEESKIRSELESQGIGANMTNSTRFARVLGGAKQEQRGDRGM